MGKLSGEQDRKKVMYVTSIVIRNLENGALILKRCEQIERMKGQIVEKI
jgi:hypothetical protein